VRRARLGPEGRPVQSEAVISRRAIAGKPIKREIYIGNRLVNLIL
jgi:hypothetical protein